MATQVWQSIDGYVRIIDGAEWPTEDDLERRSDLETEYRTGAWIVFFRSRDDDRWFFARSRRMPKPSLKKLQHFMPDDLARCLGIQAEDARGQVFGGDVQTVAEAMYAAWQQVAAAELPAKIAYLGLEQDAPDASKVSAWLRPGLARYAAHRAAMRDLFEDLRADEERTYYEERYA